MENNKQNTIESENELQFTDLMKICYGHLKLNWWWFLIANCSIITFPSIILLGTESINKIINITYILTLFGSFVCYYNVAKKFHRSTFEGILMMIVPVIMYPIMAFSKNCNYDHELIVSKNGPFKEYNEDEE